MPESAGSSAKESGVLVEKDSGKSSPRDIAADNLVLLASARALPEFRGAPLCFEAIRSDFPIESHSPPAESSLASQKAIADRDVKFLGG